MYMLIRRHDGSLLKAAVLTRTRYSMRLAAAGFDDVVELRRRGSDWLDERGQPVQFEFAGLVGSSSRWARVIQHAAPQGSAGPRVRYACQ
jgi:hypothetical protein